MATKAEAYVDTSAFIALLDHSDSHHPLFARLFADPPHLITSTLVIAEGHAWFLRRYDVRKGLDFLAFIRSLTPLSIAPFHEADVAPSTLVLAKYADQRLTLADVHGLLVMRSRKIKSCWSTDRHLGLTGVALVP
jgi:predicted nucleic acid-binding protein